MDGWTDDGDEPVFRMPSASWELARRAGRLLARQELAACQPFVPRPPGPYPPAHFAIDPSPLVSRPGKGSIPCMRRPARLRTPSPSVAWSLGRMQTVGRGTVAGP